MSAPVGLGVLVLLVLITPNTHTHIWWTARKGQLEGQGESLGGKSQR